MYINWSPCHCQFDYCEGWDKLNVRKKQKKERQ